MGFGRATKFSEAARTDLPDRVYIERNTGRDPGSMRAPIATNRGGILYGFMKILFSVLLRNDIQTTTTMRPINRTFTSYGLYLVCE